MAGDNTAHTIDFRHYFRQRVREGRCAASMFDIDGWHCLIRKEISQISDGLFRKHHDDVTIGMGSTEMIELDAIQVLKQ